MPQPGRDGRWKEQWTRRALWLEGRCHKCELMTSAEDASMARNQVGSCTLQWLPLLLTGHQAKQATTYQRPARVQRTAYDPKDISYTVYVTHKWTFMSRCHLEQAKGQNNFGDQILNSPRLRQFYIQIENEEIYFYSSGITERSATSFLTTWRNSWRPSGGVNQDQSPIHKCHFLLIWRVGWGTFLPHLLIVFI